MSLRPSGRRRLLVVALLSAAAACGDLTRPKATFTNISTLHTLFALSGAPATGYTAVNFLAGSTRADAAFAFDVAVDLDANGNTLVIPVRSLANGLAGTQKRVGLQKIATSFAALREAPQTGYDTLATQVVPIGQPLAVEIDEASNACFSSLGGRYLYAKFVVDSVNRTTRRIFARSVVDPNCGYRGLVPDSIPTN